MHPLLDPYTSLRDALPLWGICEHEGNSIISAVFPYLLPEVYYAGRNVSRYAVVRDYHAICGARLERACALLRDAFPGEEFHWHCDSTALPEVELAVRAGLGVRGRHNLLITKEYGSWVFLGEIVTHKAGGLLAAPTVGLQPRTRKAPQPVGAASRPPAAHNCASCNACINACPTGALGEDSFDKTKCLSFITQKKGKLTSEEAALIKKTGSAWGCDLCQEACPYNRGAKIDPLPEFLLDPIAHITENSPLAGRAYAWRGEGVIKRNLTPPPARSPRNPPP